MENIASSLAGNFRFKTEWLFVMQKLNNNAVKLGIIGLKRIKNISSLRLERFLCPL